MSHWKWSKFELRLNLEKMPCRRIQVVAFNPKRISNSKRFVSSSNRHTRTLFQVCFQRKYRFKPEKRWDKESHVAACEFPKFKVSEPPLNSIGDQWKSPGSTNEKNCGWKYFWLQTDFDSHWSCSQFNQFPRLDSWQSVWLHDPIRCLCLSNNSFYYHRLLIRKKISRVLWQNLG